MSSVTPPIAPRLAVRPRRLRRSPTIRQATAETTLHPSQFVLPLFVRDGRRAEQRIASLPGHALRSVDRLGATLDAAASAGVTGVILFGVPEHKDYEGSGAWDPHGPVPRAIEAIKQAHDSLTVIADVCLCEYTSHGHCGMWDESTASVANDATLPRLARTAVAYANAGADIVAPSAMMDGQVQALREALDDARHYDTAILSYAVKYASAYYGPFRDAVRSAAPLADRRAYQMLPANAREAVREALLDEAEGADMLMVKPAGPYLDIVHRVRQATNLPLAAYQVSGEFAMLKAAAQNGYIDEPRAALESLLGIRRAGADIVITYYALDAARWLAEGVTA